MLDICFNASVCGHLHTIKNNLRSDAVLMLDLRLPYGPLSEPLIESRVRSRAERARLYFPDISPEEIEANYEEDLRQMQAQCQALEEGLKMGQSLRLWLSNSAHDRCALYWFCFYTQPYPNPIYTVLCPGHEWNNREQRLEKRRSWADFAESASLLLWVSQARELSTEQRQLYEQLWAQQRAKNAPLRILIDDTLLGVEADFFDSFLLCHIGEAPQPLSRCAFEFLSQNSCLDLDFILERVDHLIQTGRVKVCEERRNYNGSRLPSLIARV